VPATAETSRPPSRAPLEDGHSRHRSLPPDNTLQDILHHPHAELRERVISALIAFPIKQNFHAAAQLASCGCSCHFHIDPDAGKVRPAVFRCRHRLCPLCSRARVAQAADQLTQILTNMTHPRQLILTVKSREAPLREQLSDLRTWFGKLRRTAFWKKNVTGGCYTVEITINEATGLWHPHLHIVFDGAYLPHRAVQQHWHRITHGSAIVWLSDVTNRMPMIKELTKYIGKPAKLHTFTDAQIREYVAATRGARMIGTFGSFHGRKLEDNTPRDLPSPDTYSITLSRLVFLASRGDITAQQLSLAISDRWPRLAPYVYHAMPQLEPTESKDRRQAAAMAQVLGRSAPPPIATQHAQAQEVLDTRIFILFTRLRLDQQSGAHDSIDIYGHALTEAV